MPNPVGNRLMIQSPIRTHVYIYIQIHNQCFFQQIMIVSIINATYDQYGYVEPPVLPSCMLKMKTDAMQVRTMETALTGQGMSILTRRDAMKFTKTQC